MNRSEENGTITENMSNENLKKEEKTLLFYASAAPLSDPELFLKAYSSVSAGRREKCDRFRFDRDKRLCLGAGVLLNYALGFFRCSPSSREIVTGENGKPFFRDKGIFFNLSHSGDFVLCAVSTREVGCDIEQVRGIDLNIARRFFFGSEYDDILSRPTDREKTEMFFRYWTLKESFMKATGKGMSLPLDSFSVTPGDPVGLSQTFDRRKYDLREFSCIPGYRCAVCSVVPDSGTTEISDPRQVELEAVLSGNTKRE